MQGKIENYEAMGKTRAKSSEIGHTRRHTSNVAQCIFCDSNIVFKEVQAYLLKRGTFASERAYDTKKFYLRIIIPVLSAFI